MSNLTVVMLLPSRRYEKEGAYDSVTTTRLQYNKIKISIIDSGKHRYFLFTDIFDNLDILIKFISVCCAICFSLVFETVGVNFG